MDGRVHIPVGFLACFAVYVVTYYVYENGDTFSLAVFGVIGAYFPDFDRLYNRHRDFWTHSAILPLLGIAYMLVWNFGRYYDVLFFALGCGFHLLFDLKPGKEGKMGTYCIVKPGLHISKKKGKKTITIDRMTAKNTDRWLAFNSLACFVACIVLYVSF